MNIILIICFRFTNTNILNVYNKYFIPVIFQFFDELEFTYKNKIIWIKTFCFVFFNLIFWVIIQIFKLN